ncbi:uncharacterized protein LOC135848034 isoform X2 [Planococcus citri]|uniref:uncharacterized protein LOC135848034 isoform X2 n=1 Tax=Planococcus citri TaxID=170843 RepID=UPI0031F8AF71
MHFIAGCSKGQGLSGFRIDDDIYELVNPYLEKAERVIVALRTVYRRLNEIYSRSRGELFADYSLYLKGQERLRVTLINTIDVCKRLHTLFEFVINKDHLKALNGNQRIEVLREHLRSVNLDIGEANSTSDRGAEGTVASEQPKPSGSGLGQQ